MFFYLTPGFVLRTPGELAVGVGQLLRRAQVVALVPGQHVYRQRLGRVRPQRVLIYIVGAFVTRLRQQADRLMPHRLSHGDEGAGFAEVMKRAFRRAIGLGRAAFPGQGVAVPPEEGVVDAQLAVFKAYQSIKQLPVQTAELAIVQALDLVTALFVLIVGAGVFAQQVARRVEGGGFHTQTADGIRKLAIYEPVC